MDQTDSRCLAIVDDDQEVLAFMRELLTELGWDATVITSASQALQEIVATEPDAILLDLHLEAPHCGWQVLDHLRAHQVTRSIPVIIWSADLRELEDKGEWLQDQEIPVLPKPFELDDLAALLDAIANGSTDQIQPLLHHVD